MKLSAIWSALTNRQIISKIAALTLLAPIFLAASPTANAADTVVSTAIDRTSSDEGYINPGPNSTNTNYESGFYIIDAGAHTGTTTQSINQGIKPYGLVYALVKAKVPVQWVIKSNKPGLSSTLGNNAPDISQFDCDGPGSTYSAKDYISGAFVVSKDFAAQAKPIIDSWKTSYPGLTVDGPCTNTPASAFPVFATIKSWPRAILDTQNGAVAVTYYTNAGIAQGSTTDANNPPAYRFASPSQLTPCDDMYIMPHADPTYATHSGLINFVNNGGDFYASCHAVSVVENIKYPVGHANAGTLAMNFLTTNGMVLYSAHDKQGSPAYSYGDSVTAGDPVAQFIGKTDLATQAGSEQIFLPSKVSGSGSQWRPQTKVVVYDPTQGNVDTGSVVSNPKNAAASLVYGPAFGDINKGLVMYQGGHSVAKGTADDVAAQRAFWNFQLLAAVSSSAVPSASDRTPTVVMTESSTVAASVKSTIPVSGYAVGGSGSYRYSWASSCFTAAGAATLSGTFANASSSDTSFTTPDVAGQISCNLTLTVIDTCGRFSFGYQTISVAPTANLRITQTPSGSLASNAAVIYTIVVTNDGAIAGTTTGDGNYASSVKLTSLIPSNATFNSVSISGSAPTGATCSATTVGGVAAVVCDLKEMTDEQSVTVILSLQPKGPGALKNTVAVTTLSFDSDLSDNVDADSVTITEDVTVTPSISITKTPSAQQVANGGKASFKITVTNSTTGGDITLTNITLTDNFNTGGQLTCIEAGNPVFNAAATGATYVIPKLARGTSWEAACTIIGVTATGTNTLLGSGTYNGVNYSATSGAVSVTKATSALQITKEESGVLKPGSLITYKITLNNNTGATATNVVLADILPLGVKVESVTATNVDTSVQETATAAVIAWDKFSALNTSSQGWISSSSWTATKSGSAVVELATSSNTTGLGDPFTSERNSLMLKASPTETAYESRTVTLNSSYKTVTVIFECSSQSSGPTLKVSMGGTDIYNGKCKSSREQIAAVVPSSVFATAGGKALKFELVANTWSGVKALFIDDVFVIGGYKATDQFVSGLISQQGLVSGWTEVDTDNRLDVRSMASSTSNKYGSYVRFTGTGSSKTATLESSFYYDPAKYSGLTFAFTCSRSKDFGDSDYLQFKMGTKELMKEKKDNSYCEKSSSTTSDNSYFKLKTLPVSQGDLPTTAGNVKLLFTFYSKKDIAIDDFYVLVREKGSSSTQVSYSTLTQALAGPYTLTSGQAKEISYTVRVDSPYPYSYLTGLVNSASVTSTQQTNPSYSVISTPFTAPKLAVTKTSDKSVVASGGTVIYTYSVTNNGTVGSTIDTITVTDEGCGTVTGPNKLGDTSTTLSAGKTWRYTCTLTGLNSDTSTVVTVSGTDNSGDPQTDDDSLAIKVSLPGLTVSINPASKSIYAGNTVSYTYLVQNTGNVSLKNVGVTAANCPNTRYKSGDPNGDLELEVGDTWTFICTTSAIASSQTSQSVIAHGVDVVTLATESSTAVNVAVTVFNRPKLSITKTVKNTGTGPSGPASSISVVADNTITYEYVVTVETSSVSSVRVSDNGCAVSTTPSTGDTGSDLVLATSETWHFTCVAGTLKFSDTSIASVSGVDGLGSRVQSDTATTTVEVIAPELLLSVTPTKEYILNGANEVYNYEINNIGGAAFTGFSSVTDSNCSISLSGAGTHALAPGEKWQFTCSKAASGTSMLSEFNVVGTYSLGSYSPETATAMVFVMSPIMTVQKLAKVFKGTTSETRTATFSPSVTAAVGDTIVFKYIVTGGEASVPEIAGINAIVLTAISDNDCQISTFAQVKSDRYNVGDSNNSGSIDKDEPWEFTCTAKASVTSNSVTPNVPIASPVTLEATTVLETDTAGIGLRMAGFKPTRDKFKSSATATITIDSTLEPPSHKFSISKAITQLNSSAKKLSGSLPAKNLSETGSATVTIDTSILNYSLSYDANGGSGSAPAAQFGSGNINVSDQGALTKTGYQFGGWNTLSGNTGTAYAVGSTYNLIANQTLYAVWLGNVIYDSNGAETGTVGTDNTNYIPGATVTLTASSPTLEKTGATFAGWNTAADGSGTSYPTSGNFAFSGNVTLYAKWTVTLAYNVNTGATGTPPSTTTHILGTSPTLPDKSVSMAKTGETFIGWNTNADPTLGEQFFVGDPYPNIDANTMLYAVWTNTPTYLITYDGDSATAGSVPTDSRNYLAAATATLKSNTGNLQKTGYIFSGWICNTVSYAEGASLTMGSANVTCKANWVADGSGGGGGDGSSGGSSGGGSVVTLPVITFNPNYAGPTATTQSASGTVKLNPNTFVRPGFTFKGWAKSPTGAVDYLDGANIDLTGNITLYAVWEEVKSPTPTPVAAGPVAVTFNSNCQPMVTEKQVNGGKIKLNTNTFTCSGNKFIGWSTSPSGKVEYMDGAIFNFVSATTLYAIWEPVAVAPIINKGELRFEVFFGMNSVVITATELKKIKDQAKIIKAKAGSKAKINVLVEGWVQPNKNPGNIAFLSKYRAKHVVLELQKAGVKATYKELYKGLGPDNLPKARHASVIVTWSK